MHTLSSINQAFQKELGNTLPRLGWAHGSDSRVPALCQLDAMAARLEAGAAFFEKHPERWVTGTEETHTIPVRKDKWGDVVYQDYKQAKMCAIGTWKADSRVKVPVRFQRAITESDMDWIENAIVAMNDRHGNGWADEFDYATARTALPGSVPNVVRNMRRAAAAIRFFASDDRHDHPLMSVRREAWKAAVARAFNGNRSLPQVQSSAQKRFAKANLGKTTCALRPASIQAQKAGNKSKSKVSK